MTRAVVVVLGQACPVLLDAIRPDAPLADSTLLTLRQVPDDVHAVSNMALPSAFRLAWIFADASALDSPALRVCQRRLALVAPVTIAIHHLPGGSAQTPAGLQFPGGVILQSYTQATFALVQALIMDFVSRKEGAAPGW